MYAKYKKVITQCKCEFTNFLKRIRHVRLLKNFSDLHAYSFCKNCHPAGPCMVIKDCTFIRDIRVNLKKHLQYFTAMCL